MSERKLGTKEEKKRIHIYVATPAYDKKVDCDYSQSLAETAFSCPLFSVNFTAAVMGNGAFIDLARNIFVKFFLEHEDLKTCTHLFFIDSDLKFEARAVIGLATAGLPICAGVYRRREEVEDYPALRSDHPTLGGVWVEGGWIMHDRVPTGFLCIERSVLEEMSKDAVQMDIHGQNGTVPRLFYTKLTNENKFMGEDFAFCDDYVKKYGKKIHVWPDFNFVHAGYKCNYNDWLVKQAEKLKEAS